MVADSCHNQVEWFRSQQPIRFDSSISLYIICGIIMQDVVCTFHGRGLVAFISFQIPRNDVARKL
jgi:hypothetical protein